MPDKAQENLVLSNLVFKNDFFNYRSGFIHQNMNQDL